MRKLISGLALAVSVIGGAPPAVYGQDTIYRYTDRETGALVFTNVPPTERAAPELAAQQAAARRAEAAAQRPRARAVVAQPAHDPNQFNTLIEKYAERHQVDPRLIWALIKAESNFNPRAVSPKGAKGLMQLMPGTAQRYGVTNVFDPEDNIQGGVRYLRFLLDLFQNDVRHSVAAYNAGENAVLRVRGIPPYRETIEHVKRVVNLYGTDRHPGSPLETVDPSQMYVYRDKDGNVVMTNLGPPPQVAN